MAVNIYAVIDTNVLVSALFSIHGESSPAIIVTPTEMVAIINEMQETGKRILSEPKAKYGSGPQGLD